LKVQGLEDEPV